MNKTIILLFISSILYSFGADKPKNKLSDTFQSPTSQLSNNNYSNLSKHNIISASILEGNELDSFWLSIDCDNIDDIAGFQFELPNNLNLLAVEGVRTNDAGFQLHHNSKGLILGFSMSGETLQALSIDSNSTKPSFIKLHVQISDTQSNLSFPIKTILAGPKGNRLSFKGQTSELVINNQSILISFNE